MRLLVAVAASFLCGCAATLSATVHGASAGGPRREAAIALRDDVPAYQKLATMQFTVPRLRGAYQAFWYLTATEEDSRRDEFLQALDQATREYRSVDLYLLAHSNRYVDWVAQLPAAQRARIRLVYDTGCDDKRQAQEWLALGVHAFVGHGDDNVAPVFYVTFLPAWLGGASLRHAVALANAALHDDLFNPVGRFILTVLGAGDPELLWVNTRAELFQRPPPRPGQP